VLFYPNASEEAAAVRRAALRARCSVDALELRDTSAGPRAVGRVTCRDGWAAARMLLALAIEDSQTPGARDVALSIRQQAPSDAAFARAVHAFVKDRVRFVREAGEVFQGSAYTLTMGAGDCDDHARVVYAIARAGGLPVRMAFLHKGQGPTHAAAQICAPSCAWAETTVDADYGEDPIEAAKRLGLLTSRGDLTQEVRTMTEKDLAPVPAGYVHANPPERVAADVSALARLGYVAGDSEALGAVDPGFRAAVAKFQRDRQLVVDGLIGPFTRAEIASALPMGDAYAVANGPPPNPVLAAGWQTLAAALDAKGLSSMSAEARAILLAIAWAESRLGSTADWGDSNNWGAVTCFRSDFGCLEHADHDASGKPVVYRFQKYPSQVEAAKGFLGVILRGGVPVALAIGTPEAVAGAMYANHYFTGVSGSAGDRIAAYASMIRASLGAVKSAAPPDLTFGGGLTGVAGGVVAIGCVVGAAALAAGWLS
jgi:Transglutaminase-like superfamily/Putative peptidoglycan binding domain